MAKLQIENTVTAAGKKRILNVRPDTPDIRDRYYEPALVQLAKQMDHRGGRILDQGSEGTCTGFALAGVINLLNMRRGRSFQASSRMLYEMAQLHDEWPGEDYEGSSCRGAIRGWRNMGVCSESEWEYKVGDTGELTIDRAMAARKNPLGAYYRLRPDIVDYHAALNEVNAIYVSARVHSGWFSPRPGPDQPLAIITPDPEPAGGHAFAIVGYNRLGFIVQNSWGPKWGSEGYAIWLYEDWQANVSDGWVFRLGIPTPTIFGLEAQRGLAAEGVEFFKRGPKREKIAGHFAHFDDGHYVERGDYWTKRPDIQQTAQRIKDNAAWYKHVVVYVHGGLNNPKSSARRIAALKEGFMRNGVYPFHIMYDTGLGEELKDVIVRAARGAEDRSEGFADWIRDKKDQIIERTDRLVEDAVRRPVTPIWAEMKRGARRPFEIDPRGQIPDGLDAIKILYDALAETDVKIHLAGHSTGGVLIGHLLGALDNLNVPDLITSCTLLAPACTVEFFKTHYAPRLGAGGSTTRLPILDIYSLTDELELDDNVAKVYRKSLLYLVSNALERSRGKPILGMQRFSKNISAARGLKFIYSKGTGTVTRSTSHGGFDNDVYTMNSLLKRILGKKAQEPFTEQEMEGY